MTTISVLLQRAKAQLAEPSVARGDAVELEVFGTRGRVAFVEDGWVVWAEDDGTVHASRPAALRRIT